MAESQQPTVRAVVAYAEELRRRADQAIAADPYARPYYPTTHAARWLARQVGPENAIETLKARASAADSKNREDEKRAERARARHRRHVEQALRDREAQRNDLTLGQRLDAALAELSVVAAAPAAALGGDRVSGSGDEGLPRYPGDPGARARARAREAVRFVENELEDARRARVEFRRS